MIQLIKWKANVLLYERTMFILNHGEVNHSNITYMQ